MSYLFVWMAEFLDDAFVASVRLEYDAFVERERRMYQAADVDTLRLYWRPITSSVLRID